MICSDADILKYQNEFQIIDPFEEKQLGPASYDLSICGPYLQYRATMFFPGSGTFMRGGMRSLKSMTDDDLIEKHSRIALEPGQFALATTTATLHIPNFLAARIEGRSSIARIGLLVHCAGGFIDPGFVGQVTMELANVGEQIIVIEDGDIISQVAFFCMTSPAIHPYRGKYQGQRGTTPSRGVSDMVADFSQNAP